MAAKHIVFRRRPSELEQRREIPRFRHAPQPWDRPGEIRTAERNHRIGLKNRVVADIGERFTPGWCISTQVPNLSFNPVPMETSSRSSTRADQWNG